MATTERRLEDHLYGDADVIAARVMAATNGGVRKISLVVVPDAEPAAVLDRIADSDFLRDVAGGEAFAFEVLPLGQPDRTVTRDPATADPAAAPDRRHEGPEERLHLLEVIGTVREATLAAAVTVCRGEERWAGQAEAAVAGASLPPLVAEATVECLRAAVPTFPPCRVEVAQVLPFGAREVGLVVLDLGDGGAVSGSAIAHHGNAMDAVARAVLDATNRWTARG